MSETRWKDDETLDQDLDRPAPNEQLQRFIGMRVQTTADDVGVDHLVDQDALYFGTDFP